MARDIIDELCEFAVRNGGEISSWSMGRNPEGQLWLGVTCNSDSFGFYDAFGEVAFRHEIPGGSKMHIFTPSSCQNQLTDEGGIEGRVIFNIQEQGLAN